MSTAPEELLPPDFGFLNSLLPELRDENRWVCWKIEYRDDKPTKVPVNPRDGRSLASCDNPETWGRYHEAVDAYQSKRKKLSGIGFVLGDGFAGVDLDDCRDQETGEIAPWAIEIIQRFNCYTEISPSGTGVKIFCKGTKPDGAGCRRALRDDDGKLVGGEIECYDDGRYFTVTGARLPEGWFEIKEASDSLAWLCEKYLGKQTKPPATVTSPPIADTTGPTDDDILRVAFSGKNGADVRSLYEGSANNYGSGSEADLALANHLAFYSAGNHQTVDRLMRSSGLVREKWDERRNGSTWLACTIAKAMDGRTDFFDWRRRNGHNSGNTSKPTTGELPELELPGGDISITSAAEKLGRLLADTGEFYRRDSVPMRLTTADDGEPILAPIRAPELCSDVETVAKPIKIGTDKDGNETRSSAICTEPTARLILPAKRFQTELPEIKIISRVPVLVERDEELIEITAYDRRSGVLASGEPPEDMPVDQAVELLIGLLPDFRFATAGDEARAVAAFITPALVAGGLLRGRAPVDLSEADQSQAGKGYRNKLVCAIYRARPGVVAQRPQGGVGSLQEAFDAQLVAGRQFVAFDNLRGKLDLPALESFLTEDCYSARVPYSGQIQIDPRRIIVTATSNAAQVTPDLANRSSAVRILKQPPGYDFRTYPEGDLLDHVRNNQPKFLGAVFSVVREWYRQGRPMLATADHDFRPWARTLGWISKNILGTGDLLAGHRAAQQRIASPGLSWLRDVALAVTKAGLAGQWLPPHQLLQVIDDANIDPELTDKIDGDDETWRKVVMHLGRKLGKFFASSDEIPIDGMIVQRRKGQDEAGRQRTEFCVFPVNP